MMKVYPVHGSGDGIASAVPHSHYPCGAVDQLHDGPAVHIAGHIGISGLHDLGHGNAAFADFLTFHPFSFSLFNFLKNDDRRAPLARISPAVT
jgi:hypothetical protein